MNAEIISVGTELLLGDIIDTDAVFLSKQLAEIGINVYRRTTVGDNLERLTEAFRNALITSDLVIAAGGLGPTADDITKEAAAACFGLEMYLDEGILDYIKVIFDKGGNKMPESNVKQALIPEGAIPLHNDNGTAPGVFMEKNGKMIALLPGPPFECEPMFINKLLPILLEKQDAALVSKTIRLIGIGESAMEELVRDTMDCPNPTVAPYAGNSEVRLRITARAADKAAAWDMITPVRDELYMRLGQYIYGEDDDTIESVVINLLTKRGLTIAAAESCTGGLLSERLTSVPGASRVFLECAVTYTNKSKINRLSVEPETLETYGAVSKETAVEMAEGIARSAGADIGVSITGIAGPGGSSWEKPVGLVYIGLYDGERTTCAEIRRSGNRERVRARAVSKALEMIWKHLAHRRI